MLEVKCEPSLWTIDGLHICGLEDFNLFVYVFADRRVKPNDMRNWICSLQLFSRLIQMMVTDVDREDLRKFSSFTDFIVKNHVNK